MPSEYGHLLEIAVAGLATIAAFFGSRAYDKLIKIEASFASQTLSHANRMGKIEKNVAVLDSRVHSLENNQP